MKKILHLLIILLGGMSGMAQQDHQFTQFMYNKPVLNPGYVGSNDAPCFTLTSRNQWLGLDGAPQTQMFSFNTPVFNKRVGLGLSINRQTIGIAEKYTAESQYSYRIRIGYGTLGLGLSASVRFLRINYSKATAVQSINLDEAIPEDLQSKYIPNFGAGFYYSSYRFYLGASIPRLIENSIDFSETGETVSKEVRHIYGMMGFLLDLGEKVQIQPQVLLKYVKGAPFDADANINFIFSDRVTTGLSYRLGGSKDTGIGESVSLVFGMQLTDTVLFGLSYDYSLSELANYSNGSIEGIFRYCIGGRTEGEEYISPRFF